jgi:hypothetical protein
MRAMKYLIVMLSLLACAASYPDRFVWVFGWNLGKDSDVAEITQILDTGAQHGLNGAMVSFGLDSLCKRKPDYFKRLDAVKQACARHKMELIPAVFGVGYGGTALAHDRNLAEGLPVVDATFIVKGGAAQFVPDASVQIANGGFEEFTKHKLKGYNFHDQPGEVSFVDAQTKHSGTASLRLENFTSNPHGHGRVSQEVRVTPRRCYRINLWAKTEDLQPSGAFKVQVLTGKRSLAPRTFKLSATGDWQKLTMVFNSLDFQAVRLYAGMWGGKAGKLWLDDWSIEEVGLVDVLHRPGTPMTVRSDDVAITYTKGKDYAPSLKLLPDSRIKDGQRLRVSWYHRMVINDGQVTACMGEPALYEIFDHEAKLLAEHLHPKKVMLNMDEIRMGGTCQACRGRNMGELLGECITKQVAALRRYMPGVEVYIWSDMLDPNHNAHGDYYLVEGDFTGSWQHIPKDIIIAVWGGKPREKSMQFFAEQGFRTLVACYYDAANLDSVKGWLDLARQTKNLRGAMYTPWQKKYELLPGFGDLLRDQR